MSYSKINNVLCQFRGFVRARFMIMKSYCSRLGRHICPLRNFRNSHSDIEAYCAAWRKWPRRYARRGWFALFCYFYPEFSNTPLVRMHQMYKRCARFVYAYATNSAIATVRFSSSDIWRVLLKFQTKNHFLPQANLMPSLGVISANFHVNLIVWKLGWLGLSDGEDFAILPRLFRHDTSVWQTDRQTGRQTDTTMAIDSAA